LEIARARRARARCVAPLDDIVRRSRCDDRTRARRARRRRRMGKQLEIVNPRASSKQNPAALKFRATPTDGWFGDGRAMRPHSASRRLARVDRRR
jgi:hypothetical protein